MWSCSQGVDSWLSSVDGVGSQGPWRQSPRPGSVGVGKRRCMRHVDSDRSLKSQRTEGGHVRREYFHSQEPREFSFDSAGKYSTVLMKKTCAPLHKCLIRKQSDSPFRGLMPKSIIQKHQNTPTTLKELSTPPRFRRRGSS